MADFTICGECQGKGSCAKPYIPKVKIVQCPKCGGTGLVLVRRWMMAIAAEHCAEAIEKE